MRRLGGDRAGWFVVAAYGAVSAALQLVWLTYAPITTAAARHYGVSDGAIGWLATMFPLCYVVFALPAGVLLDRWFRGTLVAGSVLTAAGAALRLSDGFALVLAGQAVVAVAQPLVLNAIGRLADDYLPERSRPVGIAAASAGTFAGMLAALALGAALGASGLRGLLVLDLAIAAVTAVLLCAALGLTARQRRHGTAAGSARVSFGALRRLLTEPHTRALGVVVFFGFGVFIALTTWLQPLLAPAGVSTTAAGALLAVMVVAGILGSALLPGPVVHRGLERRAITVTIVLTALGCVTLAVAPGVVSGAIVVVVIGFPLLASLPIVLDMTERAVGAAGGSTGAAFIYLLGNAGGLLIALAVQGLLNTPAAAFGLLAAAIVLGAVVVPRLAPGPERPAAR